MQMKRVIGWVICLLGLIAVVCLWVRHGVDAAIQRATSNHTLAVSAKSRVASLAVAGEKLEPKAVGQGSSEHPFQGSEGSEANARLTDTWTTGLVIADALLRSRPNLPTGNSGELLSLDFRSRLDAWGHGFCYSLKGNTVVLFSGGDTRVSPDCEKWHAPTETVDLPHGRLIKTPGGGFLLVAVQEQAK
jgi:hypothetical protein